MRHDKEYYNARLPFLPKEGCTYENIGGGIYICLSVTYGHGIATMQNVESKWTFEAFGIGRYPDGRIDWKYSTDGKFLN